ncbi:hypothetical protein ACFWF7_16370 [Nocardia sp. NPDC060256]|uniref:hypothetical protein n=1 Tax=unclassified Nocardia TaxID=2637762 RepID=UPI0036608790
MAKEECQSASAEREETFQFFVNALQNPENRWTALGVLRDSPIADERIVPYIVEFIDNATPCVISLPALYGEVRLLAAYALKSEYSLLGISETIYLRDVIHPLSVSELASLARESGVWQDGQVCDALETFERLHALGRLPVSDLHLR